MSIMGTSLDQVDDLRSWLELVNELGELKVVEGAHWDLEIGAASDVNYRRTSPSALLFDRVVGYPQGARVLSSSMSNARRLGLTLRLGTDLDDRALVQALQSPTDYDAVFEYGLSALLAKLPSPDRADH